MAIMYPNSRNSMNAPYAEQLVYDELRNLSDDFIVFHSVSWVKKRFHKSFTWYENDFLIFNKKYGLLILEVKGGEIYSKNGTIHQINSVTREDVALDKGRDPLSQAKNGRFYYNRLLNHKAKYLGDDIIIEPAVWFPGCKIDINADYPPDYSETLFAVLDSEDLKVNGGNLEEALIQIFQEYEDYRKYTVPELTETDIQDIIDAIAPDFKLIPSPSIWKSELDNAFVRLTNEQAGLLDYIQEQDYAAIQGVAGTGKTMIAVEAAKRFAEEGRKVLFLCFNNQLCEHLAQNQAYKGVTYRTIVSFVSEYAHIDVSVAKVRIEELKKIKYSLLMYDDVIIDEGQDLENEEILYFKELCAEKDEAHMLVFYDKNQLATTFDVPEWIEISECKLLLTKNCRNTFEIARTAYNVIDLDINQKINMVHGEQPNAAFITGNGIDNLYEIIQYYKDDYNGYRNDEITILTMKTENDSMLTGMKNINGLRLTSKREPNAIHFTTARKFKGLENKVIIISDIRAECFKNDYLKKVFYVACSRATHALVLLINENEVEDIAAAIAKSSFSNKGIIMMKTKTSDFKKHMA